MREQCSGNQTSALYQMSNPGFLGGGGEKDTMIIKLLMDTVFNEYFNEADPKLKVLGKKSSAFVYTNCVFFLKLLFISMRPKAKAERKQ